MDTAVSLVQSYLYMNGYFTVTEYPVLEILGDGDVRNVTDVDMLAVRFPGARRVDPGSAERQPIVLPDPTIDVDRERVDLIIGEVKEGYADLNAAARTGEVLHAALHRFGQVEESTADDLIEQLLERGEAFHPSGVRVRLMSFGTRPPKNQRASHKYVLFSQIYAYMKEVLTENWTAIRAVQSKDPVVSMLILQEKAARGES